MMLPTDHIVAAEPEANVSTYVVSEIPSAMMGLDIGPEDGRGVHRRNCVRQNGNLERPAGTLRDSSLCEGTMKVGEALANQHGVKSIIGGGDTAAAVAHAPWANKFTHISTGGGATLEYLEGRELPGVKALEA